MILGGVELGGGFAMPEFGIHINPKQSRMTHCQNMDTWIKIETQLCLLQAKTTLSVEVGGVGGGGCLGWIS